jgi:uncharacterized protein YfbU (UPF0304 family)
MMVEGRRNSGSETPLLLRTSFESAVPVNTRHARLARQELVPTGSLRYRVTEYSNNLIRWVRMLCSAQQTNTPYHANKDAEESQSQLPSKLKNVMSIWFACDCHQDNLTTD